MAGNVKPIPDGYPRVMPHLICQDAARALDFYKQVFGAQELMRMDSPDGKLAHAELRIGDSVIMMADEFPEFGNRAPQSIGGSPVVLHIYVEDVDAVAAKAVAAGAKVLIPVADQFYGDRSGRFADPFGHLWIISTHIEDVPPEEMGQRAAAWFAKK